MKKHKSHARKSTLKSKDRQGAHILLFVVVVIITFIILSVSSEIYPDSDDVGESYMGNVAGQAWGSTVRSHEGIIVEGWSNAKTQPSDPMVKFCSNKYCNYQSCQWGNVRIAGPGCLIFSYDVSNNGCAYGITKESESITITPSKIETVFSSGDAGARGLMNELWKVDRGTYTCINNRWIEER